MTLTLTTTKGDTLTSPLTHAEAIARLRLLTERPGALDESTRNFAKSLISQSSQRSLSPNQLYWVHKLAAGDGQRQPPPKVSGPLVRPKPQPPADTIDGGKVVAMFRSAIEHLARPKVTLTVNEDFTVRLAWYGEQAKYPGVSVYCNNRWQGRFAPDGKFIPSRCLAPEVERLLRSFAADPAGVAGELGRLSGNCCFCRHRLTDERSTEVGYGPICASKFNLPWG